MLFTVPGKKWIQIQIRNDMNWNNLNPDLELTVLWLGIMCEFPVNCTELEYNLGVIGLCLTAFLFVCLSL